ncbi:MAG: anaerobic ribonucleoside-triphosphate reductase activating protein [Candidatus Omnitrophota bacterium]
MRIAGLQKLSLVDYPRHLAAVVFLQGCNFRCGYCQNVSLLAAEGAPGPTEDEILEFISARKKVLEGVVVTGGEPTIHDDLEKLIVKIKKTGLKVKLDTNGSDPKTLQKLIHKGLLDYLAIDIKTSLPKYHLVVNEKELIDKVERSIRLVLLSTVPYELRTTCVPGIVNEEDFRLIGEFVRGAKKYCLQQFKPDITHEKAFQKVKPYSKKEIEHLASVIGEYVEEVEIRGV